VKNTFRPLKKTNRPIPGTVYCESQATKIFDQEAFGRLMEKRIILKHPSKKTVLIPMRNVLESEGKTRNVNTSGDETPVIVFKGVGSPRKTLTSESFGFDPDAEYEEHFFWGGTRKSSIMHQAKVALNLHREYETALREKDPVVIEALKHGVTQVPTLKPIAVFKPLAWPKHAIWMPPADRKRLKEAMDSRQAEVALTWLKGTHGFSYIKKSLPVELITTTRNIIEKNPSALDNTGIPEKFIRNHRVLAYQVNTNERIHADYRIGKLEDREVIGVRMALARHLAERLGMTFGPSNEYLSALFSWQVTADGEVLDLDTAGKPGRGFWKAYRLDNRASMETLRRLPKAKAGYLKFMNLSRRFFADRGEDLRKQVERKPHGFGKQELEELTKHPDVLIRQKCSALLKNRKGVTPFISRKGKKTG